MNRFNLWLKSLSTNCINSKNDSSCFPRNWFDSIHDLRVILKGMVIQLWFACLLEVGLNLRALKYHLSEFILLNCNLFFIPNKICSPYDSSTFPVKWMNLVHHSDVFPWNWFYSTHNYSPFFITWISLQDTVWKQHVITVRISRKACSFRKRALLLKVQ